MHGQTVRDLVRVQSLFVLEDATFIRKEKVSKLEGKVTRDRESFVGFLVDLFLVDYVSGHRFDRVTYP